MDKGHVIGIILHNRYISRQFQCEENQNFKIECVVHFLLRDAYRCFPISLARISVIFDIVQGKL